MNFNAVRKPQQLNFTISSVSVILKNSKFVSQI
jgi:hypothetical protein